MGDFKVTLGIKIKELRKKYRLSQEEFCNKLNINYKRGNLSKIEKGIITPSAEFIKSVIETYNVSAEWLLDIENTKNKQSELLKSEIIDKLKSITEQINHL